MTDRPDRMPRASHARPDPDVPPAGAPDPALVQAYRETEYRVAADPPLVLRIDVADAALAALHRAHGAGCSAFVTAFNPYSAMLSDAENASRHRMLCESLAREGIAWLPAVGAHRSNGWPAEEGVLMLGTDLAAARAIGRHWRQHAIVHCAQDAVPRLVLLTA